MNPLILSAAIRRAAGRKGPKLLGRSLIAGNEAHGYYGEFTSTEVITGDALATLAGVGGSNSGIVAHSTAGWLGFSINGKRLLIAKRPFRHSLTWGGIHSAGAAYGKQVTIKGLPFIVRLPKGSNKDPADAVTEYDPPTTHGSEWNRMFYNVAALVSASIASGVTSEGGLVGKWAQFTSEDLWMGSNRVGRFNWCQERWGTGTERLCRGSIDVSNTQRYGPGVNPNTVGWRPVLELVE